MAVIGNLLRDRARLSPDMEAIVSGNRRIRYREYNHMVNQLAHYLLESRIEKGDRIAILCKNQYPMPLIYLAAAKIGAITVPLNWRMKTDELRWILEDCRPRILFMMMILNRFSPFSMSWTSWSSRSGSVMGRRFILSLKTSTPPVPVGSRRWRYMKRIRP